MSDGRAPVYISSGAFRSRSVSEIVEPCLSQGFARIELGSGLAWAPNILDAVRDTSRRGIPFLIHNYFPPYPEPFVLNLGAGDPEILRRIRTHCRRAVGLSAELGGRFFSVHAGFAFVAKPGDLGKDLTSVPRYSLEEAHKIFVESLIELCDYACDRGVRFVVENNVIATFNLVGGRNRLALCATADEILRTYADVGSSNLGFLIDVGHLKVAANALQFDAHAFLDRVGPYVTAFHLSDNDGLADQNRPFGSEAWFLPRLVDFPRATMILEAYGLEVDEIRACCEIIEHAWRPPQVV